MLLKSAWGHCSYAHHTCLPCSRWLFIVHQTTNIDYTTYISSDTILVLNPRVKKLFSQTFPQCQNHDGGSCELSLVKPSMYFGMVHSISFEACANPWHRVHIKTNVSDFVPIMFLMPTNLRYIW